MDWKRLTASALMLGLLALPASAASITPQTTMKEIRDDPDIRASGLYTYTYVWERDCEKLSTSRDDETLAEVVDDTSAEACAAGLNYLLHEYWTFRHGAPQPSLGRALRYLGVLGITLVIRLAGVAVLARLAGPAGETPVMQFAILLAATGISFVANYFTSKMLVFRPGGATMEDRATAMEKHP